MWGCGYFLGVRFGAIFAGNGRTEEEKELLERRKKKEGRAGRRVVISLVSAAPVPKPSFRPRPCRNRWTTSADAPAGMHAATFGCGCAENKISASLVPKVHGFGTGSDEAALVFKI